MSNKYASVLSAISLLVMTSCAPTLSSVTGEGALRIGQAAFKPITWSQNDTRITVQQIKVHNEVGVELGLWKYPAMRKAVKPKPKPVAKPQEPADFEGKPAVEPAPAVAPPPTPKKKKWWQRK